MNTLGFDSSLFLNNPIDKEFRESMSKGIQVIGKQVSEGITRIATNRQTKDMLEELQQTNPNSQLFPQQAVGLIERYPLAATDKRGLTGLAMFDKAHQQWVAQQTRDQALFKPQFRAVGNDVVEITPSKTGSTAKVLLDRPEKPVNSQQVKGHPELTYHPDTNTFSESGLPATPQKSPWKPYPGRPDYLFNELTGEAKPSELPPKAASTKGTSDTETLGKLQSQRRALQKEYDHMIQVGLDTAKDSGLSAFQKEKSLRRSVEIKKQLFEYDKVINDLESRALVIPGVSPASGATSSRSTLDQEAAKAILREAGGDREKARALARERGYTF